MSPYWALIFCWYFLSFSESCQSCLPIFFSCDNKFISKEMQLYGPEFKLEVWYLIRGFCQRNGLICLVYCVLPVNFMFCGGMSRRWWCLGPSEAERRFRGWMFTFECIIVTNHLHQHLVVEQSARRWVSSDNRLFRNYANFSSIHLNQKVESHEFKVCSWF